MIWNGLRPVPKLSSEGPSLNNTLSGICGLVIVSFVMWVLVLRPDIRWWLDSLWLTRRLSKEHREFRDTGTLAIALIVAITSTTLLVAILIVGLVVYLK